MRNLWEMIIVILLMILNCKNARREDYNSVPFLWFDFEFI